MEVSKEGRSETRMGVSWHEALKHSSLPSFLSSFLPPFLPSFLPSMPCPKQLQARESRDQGVGAAHALAGFRICNGSQKALNGLSSCRFMHPSQTSS